MPRARSPIRLRKDPAISDFLDRPFFRWECDEERLRAAQFQQRDDPTKFVIVHRSTKRGAHDSKWQVSFFDKDGPVGDSQERSCQRALSEHLPHRIYRLRTVESK